MSVFRLMLLGQVLKRVCDSRTSLSIIPLRQGTRWDASLLVPPAALCLCRKIRDELNVPFTLELASLALALLGFSDQSRTCC